MEGLAKMAFFESYRDRKMSDSEFKKFTNDLKKQYNLNTDYVIKKSPVGMQAGTIYTNPHLVDKLQTSQSHKMANGLGNYYGGRGDSIAHVPAYEEAILYETGNVLNPEYAKNKDKAENWTIGSIAGSTLLGLGAETFAPSKRLSTVGRLGAIGGGFLGVKKAVDYWDKNREFANEFAKQHWEKELGSSEAAEAKFKESNLSSYGNKYPLAAYGTMGLTGATLMTKPFEITNYI